VSKKQIERGRISESISKDFCKEQEALRSFKQCLDHDNIMLSWTTFSHGANFVIVSPLADLNLHEFLAGNYNDFDVRHHRFTPLDLLREMSCVADALENLHFRLNLRGKRMACAHVDLKPDSILVQWKLNSARQPVGRWLLQDFDIAWIKESSEDPDTLAPGDFLAHFSLAKAQRNPTPFSAPELQPNTSNLVGRERDMWSFGCLLALVLAFAVGGPRLVDDLAKSKDSIQLGRAPTNYFYTIEDGKAMLKPALTRWLTSLRTGTLECRWIERTIDLVFGILVERPTSRLNSQQAQEQLRIICREEERYMKTQCWWISPEAPIPTGTEYPIPPRIPDDGLIPVQPKDSMSHIPISGQVLSTPTYDIGQSPSNPAYEVPGLIPVYPDYVPNPAGGQGQSIPSDSDLRSSFVLLRTPKKPVRSLICGGRYASLSRHTVIVHSIGPQDKWNKRAPKAPDPLAPGSLAPQNIQCPAGYEEWDLVSLCSDYIILRARNKNELKVCTDSKIVAPSANTDLVVYSILVSPS
jgi:serine/threonine protein kinase